MGKRLSDADIQRYRRDGFLFPIDAFSPEEAHGFRDRLEGFEQPNKRRIGFGISYIPTSASCRAGTRQSAMLVRGVDRYGNFDDEPRPRTDHGPAERAAHAEAVTRFRAKNAEEVARYETAE